MTLRRATLVVAVLLVSCDTWEGKDSGVEPVPDSVQPEDAVVYHPDSPTREVPVVVPDSEEPVGGDTPSEPEVVPEEPAPEPLCYRVTWNLPTEWTDGTSLPSGEIQSVYVLRQELPGLVDWPAIVAEGDTRLTQLDGTATETEGCIDPTKWYTVAVMVTDGRFSVMSEGATHR